MAKEWGKMSLVADGQRLLSEGAFDIGLGEDQYEMMVGSDGVHGSKSMPQAPYFEGNIRVPKDFDVQTLLRSDDISAMLTVGGQTYSLSQAVNTTEGVFNTEGTMPIKLVGKSLSRFTS